MHGRFGDHVSVFQHRPTGKASNCQLPEIKTLKVARVVQLFLGWGMQEDVQMQAEKLEEPLAGQVFYLDCMWAVLP